MKKFPSRFCYSLILLTLCAPTILFSQGDDPCSATSLTINSSCSFGTYTTTGATSSAGIPAPGCASYNGNDVWFSITVPANGEIYLDTDEGGITDGGMAVYSGTCGSLSLVSCDDDASANGYMPYLYLSGQTPGNTLWIRFWAYDDLETGTFDICAHSPAAPSNDDPCSATALTVGASCSYTSSTNENATASAGVPAPGCSSYLGGDVWFSFTVPASGSVEINSNTGVMTDGGMAVYSGSCGSLSLESCDDDSSPNGSMPYLLVTGQTPGNTLWIRFWEYDNDNNGTFDICVSEYTPPVAPSNDDPCSATALTVNASCSYATYTTENATATGGVAVPSCSDYAGGDVWFSFTVPATGSVEINTNVGVITDGGMAVYSGSCASLTEIDCDDDNSTNGLMPYLMLNGQTPGNTLWIRFFEYSNDNPGTFDICVSEYTPPTPPANDECVGAINVPVGSESCNNVNGTIEAATASAQTEGCGSGTADDDVWFSFVATSNAANITLANISGSTTDLYHNVYSGTCGSIGAELVCSDPNSSAVTGLTIGNTYYVRVYSWTSTSGQNTDFTICVQEVGPCGTPNNQDYCVAPAILTEGPGDFSANTSDTYGSDEPANLTSIFCGTIENNSWYTFVASSTSHDFDVVDVSGTTCSSGIQAEVYSVTEDVDGCCSNFTSVSNCWNPGVITTGMVTASGLTIGNEYILMVDGYGGDVCDFTITGWTAEGILLSIDLLHFDVMMAENFNKIYWATSSERDNNYFIVERSYDGKNFESIGKVDGAGNSTDVLNYSFIDYNMKSGVVYYRLKQVDFDGSTDKSKIISVERNAENQLSVFPNPVNDVLTIELTVTSVMENNVIEITGVDGALIKEITLQNSGFQKIEIPVNELASGVYFIQHKSISGYQQIQFIKK